MNFEGDCQTRWLTAYSGGIQGRRQLRWLSLPLAPSHTAAASLEVPRRMKCCTVAVDATVGPATDTVALARAISMRPGGSNAVGASEEHDGLVER